MGFWQVTNKADQRPRFLADRHYTRQTPGHHLWTRPGYNLILYGEQKNGRAAAFCWFRPKWESGILGTMRKDKLFCIECSLFRNETRFLSSKLIIEAVSILREWKHFTDVALPDGIITGVSSVKTAGGRADTSPPGKCFLEAGWEYFTHPGKNVKADTWLHLKGE